MSANIDSFHETLILHLQEGVCYVDHRQNITVWNSAAEHITGFATNDLLNRAYGDSILKESILSLNSDNIETCPFLQTIENQTTNAYRLFLKHQQGHRILINLQVVPVVTDNEPPGALGIFSDASHQLELDATTRTMQKLMRIDPLTKLPNKRSLFDSMKSEYLRFARYGTPFALIAISIEPPEDKALTNPGPDRDALLEWFAQQLSIGFRKADTPGRLRGATFMALLPHTNTQAAEKAAKKICALLECTPYPSSGKPIIANFGCASIARSDTLDRLIIRAKAALKSARINPDTMIASL